MSEDIYTGEEIRLLSHCTLCPRECGVNRFEGGTGYCKSDAGMNIASICIHRGEEPPISGPNGICNIFFSGCNLKCIYCQNYEISRLCPELKDSQINLYEAIDKITGILKQGIKAIGFVSPSHVVPQVRALIRILKKNGYNPITVYNTNSYDKPEVIDSLDGMIDVYLPDYKYVTPAIAKEFSDVPDYPEVALRALKRMYYQKGSALSLDMEGRAKSGMLIRHLVLPGNIIESKKILKSIAEELSTGVHLSLMSQYNPIPCVINHSQLNRSLLRSEYDEVVEAMEDLGFTRGWVQDMESYKNYSPDFRKEDPFEN